MSGTSGTGQCEVSSVHYGIGQINLLCSTAVLHRKSDRKAGGQKGDSCSGGFHLCYQIGAEGQFVTLICPLLSVVRVVPPLVVGR